jgi:hypothetical protein
MTVLAHPIAILLLRRSQRLDAETRRRGDAETTAMLDGGPLNHTTGRIVGAAIEVHSLLGPGLLERVYESCLAFELRERGLFV